MQWNRSPTLRFPFAKAETIRTLVIICGAVCGWRGFGSIGFQSVRIQACSRRLSERDTSGWIEVFIAELGKKMGA
jgi:hypothetical protein